MNNQSCETSPKKQKLKENILVLPREIIISTSMTTPGVFSANEEDIFSKISSQGQFRDRDEMEKNPAYKQIIPYLVYKFEDAFFLMKRAQRPGESRLAGMYTLGIGGHIRKSDFDNSASILDLAKREFFEEVNMCCGSFEPKFLGILNDDSNEVGQVHTGLVFILHGNTSCVCVKEELESGLLVKRRALVSFYDQMETWSQLLVKHILDA